MAVALASMQVDRVERSDCQSLGRPPVPTTIATHRSCGAREAKSLIYL
jgi:hypothetical protein